MHVHTVMSIHFLIHIPSPSVSSHFVCMVFVIGVLSTSFFFLVLYLVQNQSNSETTICNFELSQQNVLMSSKVF